MTTNPTEKGERHGKEKKEIIIMNKNQIHSKNFRGNRVLLLASKIFFALTLFIFFGLSNSVWAYERDRKALEEESLMDFQKPEAFTPFSSDQLRKKGYIFGIKTNFEVNTIWSKPKNKLNSDQLINKYFGENELTNEFRNEFPLNFEDPIGAKPAKLFEIRF